MKASPTRRVSPHRSIRGFVAAAVLAVSLVACNPQASFADDDAPQHYDARVQGFDPENVELKSSSVGGAWMILVLLGVVCVSVLFKDAKRSHLD